MDESLIKLSLSNSWHVLQDKALNNCVYTNTKYCNIQELVSIEKCLLLTRKSQDDNLHSKCRLDVKLQNPKNFGFVRFSILSEAKFIELHINEYREYVKLIKCELIESIDDMNMFQADYDFYSTPQFFSLTLIPKDSSFDRIWIFALGVETRQFSNPSTSLKSFNNFSYFQMNDLKEKLIQASQNELSLEKKSQDKKTSNPQSYEKLSKIQSKLEDCNDLKSYIDSKFENFQQLILNQIEEKFSKLESTLTKLIKS